MTCSSERSSHGWPPRECSAFLFQERPLPCPNKLHFLRVFTVFTGAGEQQSVLLLSCSAVSSPLPKTEPAAKCGELSLGTWGIRGQAGSMRQPTRSAWEFSLSPAMDGCSTWRKHTLDSFSSSRSPMPHHVMFSIGAVGTLSTFSEHSLYFTGLGAGKLKHRRAFFGEGGT